MIQVIFEASEGKGKSRLLALIAKTLREAGIDVTVQAEETHNLNVMNLTKEQLIDELAGTQVVLTEMRTFKES